MTDVVLLPSPLLTPASWAPVRDRLADDDVLIAPMRGRTPEEVLASALDAVPSDRPHVLVAHSNAGAYVPSIVQRRATAAVVLVDAILPPRHGVVALCPPALVADLRSMAEEDGTLPPWTAWWSEEVLHQAAGSAAVVEALRQDEPRLPLDYFLRSLPAPAGWDALPCAYLAFGDTYREEREEAASRGWTVRRLDGTHLMPLVRPDAVAAALREVVDVLRGRAGPR